MLAQRVASHRISHPISQWTSSDQARQVLALTANGVIQHAQNRDVQPDAIVDSPNAPVSKRARSGYHRQLQTAWIPRCPVDPMRDLAVLDTLLAAGYAIVDVAITSNGTKVEYWEAR